MKNKKSTYILLPLVLFIWGTLIYQFFSFNDNEVDSNKQNTINLSPIKKNKLDTFTLKMPTRDPFLGKIYANKEVNPNSTPILKTKKNIQKNQEIIWPSIQFKGIVSDTKDKVKIYMVVINGKTFLIKKGETINEITLKEGNQKTIHVYYQKELKEIMLQ